MDPTASELRSFAIELADAARPIALRYFRTSPTVTWKADGSAVTAADLAIESELRRRILERYPDHGILGEETGATKGRHYTWVLDPIDGTDSFICGYPLFGTLIGLLRDEEPVLGVIEAPAMAERWTGDRAQTRFNDSVAHVSHCTSLAEARLCSTSLEFFTPRDREQFDRLCGKVALTRYSGDCYAYGLLASGHCDLVIDAGLDCYDYLPLVGVVVGAGGLIVDWEARPLGLGSDGRVIAAATETLLQEAIRLFHS